jgi:hypothetical protein
VTVSASQFGPQFDELAFKLTTVSYADLVAEAKAAARFFLPDWDIEADGDAGWFAVLLYLKGVNHGISLANAWSNEFSLPTAREESSILAHAASRGLSPASATPARVKWLMTLPAPLNARSFAQYELRVTTRNVDGAADEIPFENEFPFSVGGGVSQVFVDMIAGQSFQQLYTPDDSDFQPIVLEQPGVLDGSVRLSYGGTPWEHVSTLVDSGPLDLHFITSLLPDGRTEVSHGNGVNGSRPPNGIEGTVKYRVGGGARTNVPPEALDFVALSPEPVPAGLNPLRASGGFDRPDLDKIKREAIAEWRRSELLAKTKHVEAFAEAFPGIARARAIFVGGLVLVNVIANGGTTADPQPAPATQPLKDALKAAIDERLPGDFTSSVTDTIYTVPTIQVAFTTKLGFISAEVEAGVVLDLQKLLNPLTKVRDPVTRRISFRRLFGQKLHVNEIRSVLDARPDIEKDFVVTLPAADVTVAPTSITSHVGASIIASSRNVLTVGFVPP